MPSPTSTWIRAQGLTRGFGRLRVLQGIDLEVFGGELMLVTGHNGSGKSTLLRCLAGLMAPQRGTITCQMDGQPLETDERRRAIGYVAPDLELYSELTTAENLAFTARLRGRDHNRGLELLDQLGLPHDRMAGALSSGMRQRLRWAWALLHEPKILLLDEPLQNLDSPGRRDVSRLLENHLANGLAVVANPDRLELPHVAKYLDLDD